MATYTAGCSQVGSFSYAKYFTLYVVLSNRDGNSATNQSVVDYDVYCQSSGSGSISASHQLYFELGGNVIRNENVYVNVKSPNAYIHIASGSMTWTHDNDGSKSIWVGASISATGGYGVSASIGTIFELNKIPRYANVSISAKSKTINTITYNCSVDASIDWKQYRLNGGNWVDDGSSNTIRNLTPNTTYSIQVRVRRADSGLWSESNTISMTTYDIAKISSLSDFEHGDDISANISNPASISNLVLAMKIGDVEILNRTVSTGDNSIQFYDTELDNLYKQYGNSSNLTAIFAITGDGYTHSKTCIVTLKGNQKTGHINVNGSWKRNKRWINVDGNWKRCVRWVNVNGTWRRCI